jgi:periplasmic protein TonB
MPLFRPLFAVLALLVLGSCSRNISTVAMRDPQPLTPIVSNLKYPAVAIEKKLEGKVVVAALIDTLGHVAEIKIESSTEPAFNDAAMDAVRATAFDPARFNGYKVAKWLTIPINFAKPRIRK